MLVSSFKLRPKTKIAYNERLDAI